MDVWNFDLCDYNDDLSHNNRLSIDSDIIMVEYMGEVLYDRERKEYMTLEEAYNSCKQFKYKYSSTYNSVPIENSSRYYKKNRKGYV